MTTVNLKRRPSMTRRLTGHVWTLLDVTEAKLAYGQVRQRLGLNPKGWSYLSEVGDIGKQAKGAMLPMAGLSLAAHTLSGAANVCQFSTPECRQFCLQNAGNGRYTKTQMARIARTVLLFEHPDAAMTLIVDELQRLVRKHGEIGFRPNVLSDVPWERLGAPFFAVDGVRFYDYTKDWSRQSTDRYHLTFSATERTTIDQIRNKVAAGENVAVVVDLRKKDAVPPFWHGIPAVDADLHDYRPADGVGVIAALRPKGRLNRNSPFVKEAV